MKIGVRGILFLRCGLLSEEKCDRIKSNVSLCGGEDEFVGRGIV